MAEEKNKQQKQEKNKEEKSEEEVESKTEGKKQKKIKEKTQEKKYKKQEVKKDVESWIPKTRLGKLVKEKKIDNIDKILDKKLKILESEIIDSLVNLNSDLIAIGQAKGKFGGGKRRAWRQTQKKTAEGNTHTFSCMVCVGDKDGHVGVGYGKSKETLPARTKAIRKAKLNIIKINRGCGSFDCSCGEKHSIPMITEGKCGSSVVKLIPAPQGTGLVIGDDCKKILMLAGIKDIYSKTFGQTRTTINLVKACIEALKNLNKIKEIKK